MTASRNTVRVGTGAGFSDDRFEPARDLAERGAVDYIVFECLAERTIARETLSRLKDPERGYTPYLVERFEAVLPACVRQNVRVVTNMGAANPPAAARKVREVAQSLGLGDIPVAVVGGDDVAEVIRAHPELRLMESGDPVEALLPKMAAANAYLGADIIRDALATGAPIVMTGRVADPSMFVGALMHAHGWSYDDYPKLAVGTLAGHLMECAAQLTGGCFIDPGKKDADDAVNIGFPYADVTRDGSLTLGKLEDSGGRLDVQTCTEQALYEMHDPASYITPDCVLDITDVEFASESKHRVRATGAKAKPRTPTYKVVIGYHDGYIGEGEVGYAGPNALARAKLAEHIVRERLRLRGFSYPEIRVDYIGMSSLHGMGDGRPEPYEVRLRMAARSPDRKAAQAVGFEMRTLHVNGPSGGGGGTNAIREVMGVKSVLLPREWVKPHVSVEGTL
ncbi:MAG TPA: acyclic terpene utilization AtuA family protein [Burkholderiales bacterium]|nr:acyclic terpene utilization AtuA family protein [Burkholderiales bacterium]